MRLDRVSFMFDFIHIGLGKCVSTYMQQLWIDDPGYNYVSCQSIASALTAHVLEDPNVEEVPCLNFPDFQTTGSNVLSSEGLTFSLDKRFSDACLFEKKQRYLASAHQGLSKKVFIVVRSPVSWIKSAHAQTIHQGGSRDASWFVRNQEGIILNNLNLRKIVECWTDAGFEAVIIPMELLKNNESRFWQSYKDKLGCNEPANKLRNEDPRKVLITRNITNYASLEMHASVNKILNMLKILGENAQFSNEKEKRRTLECLDYSKQWATRRIIPFHDDSDLQPLANLLASENKHLFHNFNLTNAVVGSLEKHFLTPLADYGVHNTTIEAYMSEMTQTV